MKRNFYWLGAFVTIVFTMFAERQSSPPGLADFDVIIKDGTVSDGTGAEPKQADVAIRGDRIVGIGDFKTAKAKTIIDAKGLAVAPGFINMLSWSTVSLIQDGRSQSEIRQGVSCNVASFIGATTIREYVIGFEDKQPTPAQLDQMRELVRKEMEAGALGIGTSLIYPPAFYAKIDDLLSQIEAAQNEGLKITADMYTYTAGGTGLDASLPPWTEDGGYPALFKRLRDPATG